MAAGGLEGLTPSAARSISLCILDEVDLWSVDDFFATDLVRLHQAIVGLIGYLKKRTRFLGLTASALSEGARKILLDDLGCKELQPFHRSIVPHLPRTRITPVSCHDWDVVKRDLQITLECKSLFGRLKQELGIPNRPQDVWPFLKAVAAGKHGSDMADLARGILEAQRLRVQLYEDTVVGSGVKMSEAQRLAVRNQPAVIFCREIQLVEKLAVRMAGSRPALAHSGMGDQYIRQIDRFKQGANKTLLMTRDLGKRGVDFPMAKSLIVFSPKSSVRAMDQELCRTRSTVQGGEKEVYVLFYASTYEEEKLRNVLADLVSMRMYGRFDKFTLNARWTKWLGQRKAKTLRDLLLR